MSNRNPESEHWALDKKVPIALILVILGQTAGAGWWISRTDARLDAVERRVELSAPQAAAVSDRLIRVEEKVGGIKDDLADLKSMIRRLPLNGSPTERP